MKLLACCLSQENCILLWYLKRQRKKIDYSGHSPDPQKQLPPTASNRHHDHTRLPRHTTFISWITSLIFISCTKFRDPWYILTELQTETITSPSSYRATRQHNRSWSLSSIKHILQVKPWFTLSLVGCGCRQLQSWIDRMQTSRRCKENITLAQWSYFLFAGGKQMAVCRKSIVASKMSGLTLPETSNNTSWHYLRSF